MTKDAIPKDTEPVPGLWQRIGNYALGAVLIALAVVFSLMFVTGVFIWSLLL
jgi:hypothetical protein